MDVLQVIYVSELHTLPTRSATGYYRSAAPWLTDVGGLGYIRFLAPPEKALRWIEGKLNLLGRVPHYVSVDQKTYGRYGVLPSSSATGTGEHMSTIGLGWVGGANGPTSGNGQRLGP